jgi:hypothetical protein
MRAGGCGQAVFHCWRTSRGLRSREAEWGLRVLGTTLCADLPIPLLPVTIRKAQYVAFGRLRLQEFIPEQSVVDEVERSS